MSSVYDSFYRNITDEAWEYFGLDFLESLGFTIVDSPSRGPDGGKDGAVELNNKKYIVSCKHFINSGSAVGVSDEQSILDRIIQHQAQGFIGVYSTVVSSSLAARFDALSQEGYECLFYDQYQISNSLPRISSSLLQKYGLPNDVQFVMNVEPHEYTPLNCLFCNADILDDQLIRSSMAMVFYNNSDELEYFYGCKSCFGSYIDVGWLELSQGLHQEQFNYWVSYVNDLLANKKVSNTFYQNKSNFESLLLQRMFPSNWGRWLT
ncbi:restriction endonuclease [Vibrio parahaemolyticus]|uniref:restriction endonuclease n=1 Tax=Vibrio parahaemolyticus TaxID=670 RepID=UPI00226AD6A4|nr:restriction endonuclease [Vibrio parahaemolyticus]MCX8892255.1 restriction endonuclease [Vibrio parahaemolyticus]